MNKIIKYGRQFIDKNDISIVKKSLKNELITTGDYVKEFERALKLNFNSKYAHTCSNATAGLHLAFLSINLRENDVVLMPAINFISSYSMAKKLGAKIFLVDVDKNTGQITYENIIKCIKENKIKKIKLIISMYLGGYVENNIELFKLKKKLKCYLIEDACHAIGSSYIYKSKNYKVGCCKHSDICVFSFHPVKSITTGEGGAVLTNDQKISKKLDIIKNHGILKNEKYWNYDILNLGFNYRLSDINCALGISQLKKLKKFYYKRKKIFDLYSKNFKSLKSIILLPKVKNKKNFYHLYLFGMNFKKLKTNKDNFIKFLNKKGIFPQFHYKPIYKFSFYKNNLQKKMNGSESYFRNFVSLPIYFNLKLREQFYVINQIKYYIKKNKK